jgi:hypothetical protein
VPIFIDRGAPPSTHLRTRFGGLSGHDSSLKHVLTTHNPNTVIIDLDEVDVGPQIGFSERYRSVRELLPHAPTEPLNERGIDAGAISPPTPAGRSIASTWSIRKRKSARGTAS